MGETKHKKISVSNRAFNVIDRGSVPSFASEVVMSAAFLRNEDRGALRGIPGSAYPQPEPNATELPSSAPGRLELIELQASAPSPTPTRTE